MIPKDGINLEYVKAAAVRRWWYFVLPFFVVSMVSVTYCLKAPRVYKAETLILVEPQRVPDSYVKSTVTTELSGRLRTITQQVKSRTRLENVINEYDLYPEIRANKTMTDAVEAFRETIEINVKYFGARSTGGAFIIAFTYADRLKARDVTNNIARLFIDDNLKLREEQATGTTVFLSRELDRMKQVLQEKETVVREFKQKYIGLLPENMEKNYHMMASLERQLSSANASIQLTKDRQVILESQLSNFDRMASQSVDSGGWMEEMVTTESYEDWVSTDLENLRGELDKLRVRYGDKHPDVIRLKAAIAKLETNQAADDTTDTESGEIGVVEEGGTKGRAADTGLDMSAPENASFFDLQRQDLAAQLSLLRKELDKLEEEQNKLKEGIEIYRHRIEFGPQIEQKLIGAGRGYNQARKTYESLLKKQLAAKLAENLERAQQGEQFRIVDPATLPERPVGPKKRKILAVGFIVALALGLGLAYGREYLDSTFWSIEHFESVVKLPVLVSVPVVYTKRERSWNLIKRAGALGALASMTSVLLYALFVLWKMDQTAVPIPFG